MKVTIITKNGSRKTYDTIEELRDDDFLVWKSAGDLYDIDIRETALNLEDYWTYYLEDQVEKIIFDGAVSYEVVYFDEDGDITGIWDV